MVISVFSIITHFLNTKHMAMLALSQAESTVVFFTVAIKGFTVIIRHIQTRSLGCFGNGYIRILYNHQLSQYTSLAKCHASSALSWQEFYKCKEPYSPSQRD